ncbi:endo-1%2C4-D-glucanase [Yersinia pseudotuberculosis]|nr:endo-1%2C4-D-glucanase [Yersinia pseudotuberculosis]
MVVMFKHLASMFLLLASFSLAAASNWPAWQQFKQDYISEGGRIIDPGALNPKTWTSALLLFYLSPVFCRTHSACFQANALCIVIMDIFYNVTL